MTKPHKKTARPTEITVEDVLDGAIATLKLGLDKIREEIELIASGKAAKSRHDDASRIAFLTSRVGSIADSVRKVEAARSKRLDDLTPAIVLSYLRGLDASERAQIVREANHIDTRRSGLS